MKLFLSGVVSFVKAHTLASIITVVAVVTVGVATPIVISVVNNPKKTPTKSESLVSSDDSKDTDIELETETESILSQTGDTVSDSNAEKEDDASNVVNSSSNKTQMTSSTSGKKPIVSNSSSSSEPSNRNDSKPQTGSSSLNSTSSKEEKLYSSVKGKKWVINKKNTPVGDYLELDIKFDEKPQDVFGDGNLVYSFVHYYPYDLYDKLTEEEKKLYDSDAMSDRLRQIDGVKYIVNENWYGNACITFGYKLEEDKNIVSFNVYEGGKDINMKFLRISETQMKLISISNIFSIDSSNYSILSVGDIFTISK